jgi:dipeptidyl aminopeptidase/acylaminoacyl peptidase
MLLVLERRLIAFAALGLLAGVSMLTAEPDGHVFSATREEAVPAWDSLPVAYRAQLTREELDRIRGDRRFDCLRVVYSSGGLRVTGFLYKPARAAAGAPLPAVVYNRGGNRDYGAIDAWDKLIFHRLAESGFVVVASQYRGADGGEGRDEFGGSDVRDVLSLFPLVRGLGYVDMSNVFMLGFSRGGMMTYLAIRDGAPIRAAAVIGGVSDLPALAAYRPRFLAIWSSMWPSFDRDGEEQMLERSAIRWPERLNKPLLLLHGVADRRVPLDQSLRLAAALRGSGRTVELRVFPGDGHELGAHSRERDHEVIVWFRAYAAPPETRRTGG